jgi:hypothetical protein
MSRTDDSSTPDHSQPRRGPLYIVVAGIIVALLWAVAGPARPSLARPSLPEIAATSWLAPPAPGGAVGHRACCAHPDPPHTAGVPYRWCVSHHTCWAAHQFVARHVKRFQHRRVDGVTHRILPDRFERKVRRVFAHRGCGARCGRSVEEADSTLTRHEDARRDSGGYEDWVDDSDCVVHGYGCYFPTNPRPELSRVERTFLWCSGTVVVAGLPGGVVTLGEAAKACFWGAAYYWMEFWK